MHAYNVHPYCTHNLLSLLLPLLLLLLLLLLFFFFYFFLPLLLLLSYMCRLFAGFVPRVCWISLGGFIFLGAYEKSKHVILTLAAK